MKIFRSYLPILVLCLGLAIASSPNAFEIDFEALTNLGKRLNSMLSDIGEEEEIEVGGNLVSGLLGAAPLVDDEELQKYVNDVGAWVAKHSARPELPWSFAVIDSDGVNAFAAPGGYIVVTLGLYRLLENEAQLAGVLAHEISHVVQKHHLEALQKTMSKEFWTGLAVIAVEEDRDRNRLGMLVNAGVQLYATGLDREYEYEADLRGVVLAARAGYDPFALLDVLTTLDSVNPAADEMAVFLKTHPPTGDRLTLLADSMDGKMDVYATGKTNRQRFRQVAADR